MTDENRQSPTDTVSHGTGIGRLVNLDHAVGSIPDQLYWLLGKGRTRPTEPLYAVQIIDPDSGIAVSETEGENLVDTIRAAIEQLNAFHGPEGA